MFSISKGARGHAQVNREQHGHDREAPQGDRGPLREAETGDREQQGRHRRGVVQERPEPDQIAAGNDERRVRPDGRRAEGDGQKSEETGGRTKHAEG